MKHTLHRLFCLLLCAVLFVGVLPALPAAAATQLGAPSDITWSPTMPGCVYWTVNKPVEMPEAHYRVDLYKNGKKVQTKTVSGYSEDIDYYDVRYFECSFDDVYTFTTGDYHVTVTAIAKQSGYTDSKTVESGVWSYTHPGTRYSRPTNLRWNYPFVEWDSNYPDGEANFQLKIYYSATDPDKLEELPWGRLSGYNGLELVDYISQYGKGYYAFKVRTYSWDITQKYHSAWTGISEPFYSDGRRVLAPTLTVSTDSATGCPKLKWNKVTLGDKYRLYRSEMKTGTYTVVKTTKTSSSFLDTTAEPGKTYFYKVRALFTDPVSDEVFYSAYSNTVNDLCTLGKPEVTVSLNSSGDPVVRWDTMDGAVKYYVYRSTSKSSGFKHVKSAISARSFTDTTAATGTRYYYKVKAVHANTNANSVFSSARSIVAK